MNKVHQIFIISLTFLLIVCKNLKCQTIPLGVVSTSGETFKNENLTLDWTLGELLVGYLSTDSIIVSSGLHQSSYEIISTTENPTSGIEVKIFPNPTSSMLVIEIDKEIEGQFDLILFDSSGNQIWKMEPTYTGSKFYKDLESLPSGSYILSISKQNKSIHQLYKILKID
ncbi:T9SS type A sorting domain-containing protein [Portibacter marinus]|uniref:T9SS type A sorting domain-containing protein n=1 Tax=Portibacter marinus TaxID=2898660 RepID=UPI001F1D7058|nr:T9SS type A sorting domain-containing protein [Portibacter marinus]